MEKDRYISGSVEFMAAARQDSIPEKPRSVKFGSSLGSNPKMTARMAL
jgi:hypothetical protein